MRITRSPKIIVTAVVLGLVAAGTAFAFYTVKGDGAVSAQSKDGLENVTFSQTVSTTSLVPGGSIDLKGRISNPNAGLVGITGVTAAIVDVTKAAGATGACTPADYSLTGTVWIDSDQIAGLGNVGWVQPIEMLNSGTNQDGCKGATVKIALTVK